MRAQQGYMFDLDDLKDEPGGTYFTDNSTGYLAGRCLLDVIEFLRVTPLIPGRFRQITSAHAMRMSLKCLTDIEREDVKLRLKGHIARVFRMLQAQRRPDPPHYGDDMWDWAYVVEAFASVGASYPGLVGDEVIEEETRAFYACVTEKLDKGLTFGNPGEWFGPAVAVAAYRVLSKNEQHVEDRSQMPDVLHKLKQQALLPVQDGRYMGAEVRPEYHAWHFGQVVDAFPKESHDQQSHISRLDEVERLQEKPDRCYALSRIIQGAARLKDTKTLADAILKLYDCQESGRPFGSGLLGDSVKGSVNVLEALWGSLSGPEIGSVDRMLDALVSLHKKANTVGIVVALDREMGECESRFRDRGAEVTPEAGFTQLDHTDYRAVMRMGKAVQDAERAARDLIQADKARWLIVIGIAGSLGRRVGWKREFRGPCKGDVVVAASVAPYDVRQKVRREAESVPVPFAGYEWDTIPTDTMLFRVAHEATSEWQDKEFSVHEGLIVTADGIRDHPKAKKAVLAKWPGGLAVEEEGHAVALVACTQNTPFIVIRGISDLAEGDKSRQKRDPKREEAEQRVAARNAAAVAVRLVERLSNSW